MTQQKMTLIRFTEILAAYGADPDHWPRDERAAVIAFTAHNTVAQALLDDAGRLDAALDQLPDSQPAGAGLQARLLRIAVNISGQPVSVSDNLAPFFHWIFAPRRLIPQVAGFALAAYLGVLAGLGGTEEEGDLSAYMFGADDEFAEGWDLEGENQ